VVNAGNELRWKIPSRFSTIAEDPLSHSRTLGSQSRCLRLRVMMSPKNAYVLTSSTFSKVISYGGNGCSIACARAGPKKNFLIQPTLSMNP
jgi:hypothetical protein